MVSIMNERTKMKISNKLKNRKKNEKTKRLISKSLTGKNKSQQHKQAISEAMKNYWKCRLLDKNITTYQEDKTCRNARKIIEDL